MEENRSYLVGRMCRNNVYGVLLTQALIKTYPRFKIIVYNRADDPSIVPAPIASTACESDSWIRRTRPAPVPQSTKYQEWTISWSLADILTHLRAEAIHMQAHMSTRYYEYIIIDPEPNRETDLLDMVTQLLRGSRDNLSREELLYETIKQTIPEEEQAQYLEDSVHIVM